MEQVLSLYDELNAMGVSFYHWDLDDDPAITLEMGDKYAVFMDFANIQTRAEETVIVAHEGGHIATGATHKINSPCDLVEIHENRAQKWAIKKLVPKDKLDAAVSAGYTEPWQLAEYFNVTEEFMRKAMCWYINGNLAVDAYY